MKYALIYSVLLVVAILQDNVLQVESFQASSCNKNLYQHQRTISSSTFTLPKCVDSVRTNFHQLSMAENEGEFWQQQRDLMNEMTDQNEKSLKDEQQKSFAKVQNGLLTESIFITSLMFSLLWLACDNPFVPLSYIFGSVFGVAYAYGLGKYVETVGGTIDDAAAVEGAGVGQARFAFLILLFVFVGKFRAYGLLEIPSIMGFFTYQLATLSQGLKEERID